MKLSKKTWARIGMFLIVGFIVIARGVSNESEWVAQLDVYGNEVFRLDVPMETSTRILSFTQIGSIRNLLYTALAIGAILLYKKEKIHFFWFGITMAIAGGLAPLVLKNAISRARPTDGLFSRGGYSFPSGHTMGTLALYGLVLILAYKYIKNAWLKYTIMIASLTIIILISWSRIHLGVHFLTDIIASIFLGVALLIGAWLFLDKFEKRF